MVATVPDRLTALFLLFGVEMPIQDATICRAFNLISDRRGSQPADSRGKLGDAVVVGTESFCQTFCCLNRRCL